jgi:hypothetical protein
MSGAKISPIGKVRGQGLAFCEQCWEKMEELLKEIDERKIDLHGFPDIFSPVYYEPVGEPDLDGNWMFTFHDDLFVREVRSWLMKMREVIEK